MDREKLQSFLRAAEVDVAALRRSLLIIAQTGDASDVSVAESALADLKKGTEIVSRRDVAVLISECQTFLARLSGSQGEPSRDAYKALDVVASIEASLLDITFESDDFADDIHDLLDATFGGFSAPASEEAASIVAEGEQFEIDEETLEIFRAEADELLANIGDALVRLGTTPDDQNALWEVRRNAHTLKGAAGIVGLNQASGIAHRMEDLLDKMVERRCKAEPAILEFLQASSQCLADSCAGAATGVSPPLIEEYQHLMESLVSGAGQREPSTQPPHTEQTPTHAEHHKHVVPTVRVPLDKLDELLRIARNVSVNRTVIADRLTEICAASSADAAYVAKLKALFEIGRRLSVDLRDKLLSLRMVRFGMLETRLGRTVHVTCLDEDKKATLAIETPDVEIDTQTVDGLIEPLLHLIKNAVVHGIERAETRRLLGKPDAGLIRIHVEADSEALVLSVTDDGGGISVPKLKEKAVMSGVIDEVRARSMTDREALELVFDRGLTTAAKLDLNAGRGVGMSIVKEAIEARGGTVTVESKPQSGTTFTIAMPLTMVVASSQIELYSREGNEKPLVLIVDDSSSIRRMTQRSVEQAGMSAITANNGAEALELLLNGEIEPDLILSDIEMPQIDGWQLLEYVKTDDNFGHIPVVIMTSLVGPEHRSRAFELGATDFVQKPFDARTLESVLEQFTINIVA